MSTMTLEQVESYLRNEKNRYPLDARGTELLRAYAALLRERESAKAVVTDALDYVPGELDKTAPDRIWLQIDTSASSNDREEPWPSCDGVTWQDESVGGLEIQYVRADLVAPMLASARPPDMVCEQHPWSEWPHDDCAGPGMPGTAQYEALVYLAKLASARVPDELKSAPASPLHPLWGDGYLRGWNACRAVMLAAAPKPETEE